MLDLLHVNKTLNGHLVIDDCSFTVKPNTVFGIVGVNGVGKTTILRLCSGILKPDAGTILLGNETIYGNMWAKKDIVFISDTPYFEPGSTVKSIYKFYSSFYQINYNYFNYLLDLFELKLNDALFHLSKGKLKRVFLAIALAISPKLLLLDETFDGLDPVCKRIFKEELRHLILTKPINIVLTSHSLRELSDICDAIGYLEEGKLITLNDNATKKDPIYRVYCLKKPGVSYKLDELYILKKEETTDFMRLDVYSNKEQICYTLREHQFLELTEVPFEDWIVYQMEVLR